MNRAEWRARILNQRSWNAADADASFEAQVNRVLDESLKRVAFDVPAAFVPDEERVLLVPDVTQTTHSRTLAVTTDTKVMSLGSTASGGAITVDGTWDGLMHLEAQSPDGTWHRRQVREFWEETAGVYAGQYLFSIDRPWRNATDSGMSFRLHQPEFFLRDDTISVEDARVWDSTRTRLSVMPEKFARMVDDEDFRGETKGRPEYVFRSRHFQLDAPNRAPTAALDASEIAVPWLGPEPVGAFTYLITYVWGKKSMAPGGVPDPLWESSPSPASSVVTLANTARAVVLTLPEIDWQVDFNVAGSVRASRSGLRKRIYRARSTVAGSAPLKVTIEYPNVYQFLAEVDGATTTYTDNGTVVPDYYRRLPESHGYYAWKVSPHQDAAYEIDVRVLRKPRSLGNDYDAPRVHPAAEPMLIEVALHYLCRIDRAPEESNLHLKNYERLAEQFRAQFANPARIVPAIPWSPSGTRITDPYRYGRFTS